MRFRIKQLQDKCWAQVKLHWYSSWKTIGLHLDSYGLYPEDHTEYGLSVTEACKRIDDYANYIENKKLNPKRYYVVKRNETNEFINGLLKNENKL